jgi:hypothetical protein
MILREILQVRAVVRFRCLVHDAWPSVMGASVTWKLNSEGLDDPEATTGRPGCW